MNKLLKRILFMTLVVCMVIAAALTVSAAPTTYSQDSNSGLRHEGCTTLSGTGADDYYAGNYTYDNLSTLSPSALLTSLRKLMTDTHSKITTYAECKELAPITDCQSGGNGESIVMFYSSHVASYDDFANGTGWNREHVWPQSLGGFGTTNGGADLHHVRPSEAKINSTRGNHKYGETSGTDVTGNLSSQSGGTYGNDIFEPLDNVKGDVARICLYVYVRWGATSGYTCDDLEIVFTDIETLLAWCELDPVDTWEMGRNEVVYGIQGNRNVFIDYPELAWLMLGEEVPENMSTPSTNTDGTEPDACKHTNTTLVDKKNATCTENGYTGDVKCLNCTQIVTKGSVIIASGHSYGAETVTKAPTETETGTAVKTCSKCGDEVIIILSATGFEIEIVSNNVFYTDTMNLMYAVRAPEKYDVVLKIYDKDDKLVESVTAYNTENVKGETLKTFTSKYGVPAQDIDTEFFATAELLDGDTVIACSDKERYSVLEYLYERLTVSEGVTEAQATMYERLLRYANSADVVVNEATAENSISNYSYVMIENGTLNGYTTAMLISGAKLSALETDYTVTAGMLFAWNIEVGTFGDNVTSKSYTLSELENSFAIEGGKTYKVTPTSIEPDLVAKTYSYTFTQKMFSENGTVALGSVNWTLAGDGGYLGNDGTKGHQFGSGNNPYKSMTLTSDSFSNVSKIVINTSGASSTNAVLNVYVGATLVKTITLTSTATTYTVDVADISGAVKLEYTQTSSKAIYLKSIEVSYAE